jgi:hypothetical protein
VITANTKNRLALNGLLLCFILGLLWFINQSPPQDRMVTSLYDESMGSEIHSISIYHQQTLNQAVHGVKIEIKKIANKWQIIKPIEANVDTKKIQHLMTILSDPISAHYSVKGKDLSLFGLDKERVSLSFNQTKIQFGSLNPITHKRYLRKGETIYIVSETVYGLLVGGVDRLTQTHTMLSD